MSRESGNFLKLYDASANPGGVSSQFLDKFLSLSNSDEKFAKVSHWTLVSFFHRRNFRFDLVEEYWIREIAVEYCIQWMENVSLNVFLSSSDLSLDIIFRADEFLFHDNFRDNCCAI